MMTTRAAFLFPRTRIARFGAVLAFAIAAGPAAAAELEQDQSFALLVASHQGGEGQRPLQFSGAECPSRRAGAARARGPARRARRAPAGAPAHGGGALYQPGSRALSGAHSATKTAIVRASTA